MGGGAVVSCSWSLQGLLVFEAAVLRGRISCWMYDQKPETADPAEGRECRCCSARIPVRLGPGQEVIRSDS